MRPAIGAASCTYGAASGAYGAARGAENAATGAYGTARRLLLRRICFCPDWTRDVADARQNSPADEHAEFTKECVRRESTVMSVGSKKIESRVLCKSKIY